MKLPPISKYKKSVRIKNEDYKIQFVSVIDKTLDVGQCDPEAKVILIKKKQNREETAKTFIHEILHGIEEEYEIKLSHKAVYQLEEAIFQVLMDNF